MSKTFVSPRTDRSIFTWTALLVAVATVAGSLYLSGGMGLEACPLCFYQRTFAMAVVGILLLGLLCRVDGALLGLLALPSAIGGLGVAIFHVYLVQSGKLECPKGIFDRGPAPVQSLAAFCLLIVPLLAGVLQTRSLVAIAGLLLGGVFVWASISFNPPPKKSDKPYDTPPKTCRVPYQQSVNTPPPGDMPS